MANTPPRRQPEISTGHPTKFWASCQYVQRNQMRTELDSERGAAKDHEAMRMPNTADSRERPAPNNTSAPAAMPVGIWRK